MIHIQVADCWECPEIICTYSSLSSIIEVCQSYNIIWL